METSDNVQEGVDSTGNSQAGGASSKPEMSIPIFLQVTPNYREILNELDKLSQEKYSKRVINDLVKITPASTAHHSGILQFLNEN